MPLLTSAMATCSRSAGRSSPNRATTCVIDPGRLLQRPSSPERDALADQRPGHLLAQRRLGVVAEPGHHLVVDRGHLLRPAQLPSVMPL